MADRLYNAQIDYPFVYHDNPDVMDMILDALFYVSPDDVVVTPGSVPADIDEVGAWLHYAETLTSPGPTPTVVVTMAFYVKVPNDPDVYPLADKFPDTTPRYVEKTFVFNPISGTSIQTIRAEEDDRSVLSVNVSLSSFSGTPVIADNRMEPGIVVPCSRKITQVNLYNEFRASDPAQRNKLPPDYFQAELFPGDVLEFNDGYNCNVSYNESTQTLRINGGVGFGLGRPDSNPWDDTDEDFDDGVRDVNGVNTLGIVPIEVGAGLTLDTSVPGELRILVRNQGDLACPPE